MKKSTSLFFLLFATIYISLAQTNDTKFGINLGGYLKTDMFYDTS